MYVKMKVDECDCTDKKYDGYVDGAGALCQGATGRWCVVMYAGPEYLEKCDITPVDYDEAVAWCEKRGGTIDF